MTDLGTKLELLSPARDLTVGKAAISHGADAVYIGGPAYGARASAGNTISEIAALCTYAHRYHARVYLTLNTLLLESELEQARQIAYEAYEAGVDALIVQDMALLAMDLPAIDLHASTQCDIRTPEKAAFLDSLGFSQLVLARELTLEEIARIRSTVTRARLEAFVHGALCVSYSGQCYLSSALRHRSANRGECAQLCRLPYRVFDYAGHELLHDKHVLSLKDNNQSANLEALIEAGVTSFKIEGRLKDVSYVKNITAYYRKALDALIEKHVREGWCAESLGRTAIHFTPDPERTFFRGATEYFTRGRRPAMASLQTPKSLGKRLGTVESVQRTRRTIHIALEKGLSVQNADGLVYFDANQTLQGLAATRAENAQGRAVVTFFESLQKHPDLVNGTTIFRNRDVAFEKILASEKSAERKIPVTFTLTVLEHEVRLYAQVGTSKAVSSVSFDAPTAKDLEENVKRLHENLAKTGNTAFILEKLILEGKKDAFLPASLVNTLRREALEGLQNAILKSHVRKTRAPELPVQTIAYPRDYRANVANSLAREFLRKHGVRIEENAFEVNPIEGAELMRTRYCLRFELGNCPRQLKASPNLAEAKEAFKRQNAGHLKPEPYTLLTERGERLLARFDCKACEMVISRSPKT